jgi:hypothetical protein
MYGKSQELADKVFAPLSYSSLLVRSGSRSGSEYHRNHITSGKDIVMSTQLRSIGAASCAKVFALLYASLGFLMGLVFSVFIFLAGMFAPSEMSNATSGPLSLIFGIGSILFFPVLYGVMGAIGGLIMAGLYNVVARFVGGIELEIE